MCGEVEGKRMCEYGRGRGREKVHEEGEGCEDVSKGVSLKKEGRTHAGERVCAGGKGVHKSMWVSEGEGVYVRGREDSYVQKKKSTHKCG